VEVPAGTKASTTHHVPQKVSEELGEG
jgi:hypothetical protein